MDFELKFESLPNPDCPLRYAEVPWDSETFGFPVYDLRLPAQISSGVGDSLGRLLAELTKKRPNLVVCRAGLPPAGACAPVTVTLVWRFEVVPLAATVVAVTLSCCVPAPTATWAK